MHLFISPHPDDAALSCGGTIHQLVSAGATVVVITTMSGDSAEPVPNTPLVRELHERWKINDQPARARRTEDKKAIQVLGAQLIQLDIPDCVYRVHEGNALYPDVEAIFGDVHPDDPAYMQLDASLMEHLLDATHIYAPLAVGHHVDHQLVREWALGSYRVLEHLDWVFYEDYPYSQEPSQLQAILDTFPVALTPDIRVLRDIDIEQKLRSIAYYESQISTFWRDTDAMQTAVRDFMTHTGNGNPAERLWHLTTERATAEQDKGE